MTGQSWKRQNALNKSWTFNFDLSYFWYPLRYRVIQYLIHETIGPSRGKLLASVRAFYHINGALLKLIRYTLCFIFAYQSNSIPLYGNSISRIMLYTYNNNAMNDNFQMNAGDFLVPTADYFAQHCFISLD